MKRALILFATKYGSSQEIAEALSIKLEVPAKNVMNVKDGDELDNYDTLIIGSPIYYDDILDDMKHFINSFFLKVNDKNLVLYTVHGATRGHLDRDYSLKFANYFTKEPILRYSFLGRATKESLGEKDFQQLQIFYKNRLKKEFSDFDYFNDNQLDKTATGIKDTIIKSYAEDIQ